MERLAFDGGNIVRECIRSFSSKRLLLPSHDEPRTHRSFISTLRAFGTTCYRPASICSCVISLNTANM